MRIFSVITSDFAVLTAMGVSLTLLHQAYGAEKYPAQVEDGTPKSIGARVSAEDLTEQRVGSVARKPTRPVAVKKTLSPELVELKRQNSEMKRRLEILEEARSAQKAANAQEAADLELGNEAPADATDAVALERDVAPSAEAELPALIEEAAPIAKPAPTPAKVSAVQKKVAPAPVAAPVPVSKFDKVPDNRVGELAERLKYANDILKRYGRAYDYRVTTLKELRSALTELEKTEQ